MILDCFFCLGDEILCQMTYDVPRDAPTQADAEKSKSVTPVTAEEYEQYSFFPDLSEIEGKRFPSAKDMPVFWRVVLTDSAGNTYEAIQRFN